MPSFKRPLVDLEPVEAHNAQPARVGKRVRISDAAELDAKDVNDEEDSPFEPEEPQSGSEDDGEDDDEYRQREEQYELQHSQAIQRQLTQLGENSPNENGILESVECVNFMCHKHFSVELGPLINFIVGKNGSGKSAILTAITLCLGGKASVTNRGQSLKKFIKEGQESATIIVRIKNGGDNAYRQSEYGESIIVERHFSRSGSSGFKLKNARGRIVSTKKSDLDDITDFYVLQIDNPMNVLSQDLARQFLSTSSPTEKYKFFVKGVQLEQLDQDYRLMEESVNQNAVKLNVYREELKIAEAELEKARKKQKLLDKHDKLNQRRHETRKILVWAIVQNQEMRCGKISRTIEKISAKMEETEDEIQRLEQALTTTEQKEEEAQQEHAGAIASLESHQSERSEIQERLREAKNERHAQQGDNRSIREHIKELEATIERTKDSIAEERRRLEELDNGKSNVLQNEIEEKQGEAAELKRKSEELRATLRPLQQEAEDAQRNAESKRQPVSAQQSEIEQAEYRLQSLKRNKDQQRTGFPPQLPALLNAIKAEQSSFSKPPVGPLGNHIRLLKPKWSFVLEQTFGGVLSSFIVRSKRDMNTLQGIMRRVRCQCPVYIASDDSYLDTSGHEPDEAHDTILRVLDIDSDLVRRQLIIGNGIEQVLLIENLESASRVMFDGSKPRNAKRCYVLDRHNPRRGYTLSYNRTGGPSQSPIPAYTGQPRLKTDHESQIRIQQDMLNALRDELRQLEDERRSALTRSKKCQEAVTRCQRQLDSLRIQIQRVDDRIAELQDEVSNDELRAGRLLQLQEVLKSTESELEAARKSQEMGAFAFEEKLQKVRAVKDELAAKDRERQDLLQKVKDCEERMTKQRSKKSHYFSIKNEIHVRLEKLNQAKAAEEEKRDEANRELEGCLYKAQAICARIDVPTDETPEELLQKYHQYDQEYKQAMRQMGTTPEEISAMAEAADKTFKAVKRQVTDFSTTQQRLVVTLAERKRRWKLFRSYITSRAKLQFTYLLSERGFRGKIVADHANKLLDIKVEPDITTESAGREAKTLSGGEKSFSQICLLLSLWEAMGSPIRCLDEFDVYMDSVNRRLSIELLMNAARRSVGKQFMFITPGSRADIKTAPDVKVNELAEPLRGQSRLPFRAQ